MRTHHAAVAGRPVPAEDRRPGAFTWFGHHALLVVAPGQGRPMGHPGGPPKLDPTRAISLGQ
ncbi:hypothetical protein [Micromonospora sp. NPDC049374]|uniref:hypothetical protein n=1 Tax=Micromonospora sp. NPDC049374 TaxID=3154352 RepID=UPI0034477C4A